VSNRWVICLSEGDNGWKRPLIPRTVAKLSGFAKKGAFKAPPKDEPAPH